MPPAAVPPLTCRFNGKTAKTDHHAPPFTPCPEGNPTPMPDSAIPTAPASRHRAMWWDRLAIILLGIAGCALSYDALRQMATAVHIRDQLAYLFPVVIDGFIAYGVRALLVLREAPMPARLYAWTLFSTATAASIWANGLHALALNRPGAVTLRLGDGTVTVLSAIAPLALAGATHLHILITRYGGTSTTRTSVDANVLEYQDGTQPAPERPAGVPYTARADLLTAARPRQQQSTRMATETAPCPRPTKARPKPDTTRMPIATKPTSNSDGDEKPQARAPWGIPVALRRRALADVPRWLPSPSWHASSAPLIQGVPD